MRPRHRPARWIAIWLGGLALVAIGSLMPAADLPTPSLPGLDKLQHVVGHGALSAYAAMLFADGRARWGAAIALLLFGIGLEGAQEAFTASREGDARDVAANALGVALGQLVALTPAARLLEAIDARLHA